MTGTRSPHLRFGLIVAAIAFLLDQLTKWVVIGPLSLETQPDGRIALLPIFNLQWAENCGISLSMFARCDDTQRWTLVAVTALVAVAVAFWMTREKAKGDVRSEEHTSELQSLMRISYAVFCLKKKK